MFNKINNIYALIIGNEIESCREDVKRMKKLLNKYKNIKIKTCLDCNSLNEVVNFCKENFYNFYQNDLLIIHYSGHGEKIGKKINNKMYIVSTWVNPDNSQTHSDIIDNILSNLNCSILLISDSCHSQNFGNFYSGKSPFIFIGSSSINNISKEYIINSEVKNGILVCLFEEILKNHTLNDITISEFKKLSFQFFNKNRIKIKPVIKFFNIKE